MESSIVPTNGKGSIIESVVIGGDLSKLSPEQRVSYYRQVCDSLGLNPLTRPFDYIMLNGKLTLYARKDATEQLRRKHMISIDKPDIQFQDEWIIVTVVGYTPDGRKDSDIGVVNKKAMSGDFGNAVMKAVTKAKRRLTLSMCGLGMLDETEVETIPDARHVIVQDTGEVSSTPLPPEPDPIPAAHDAPVPFAQGVPPMTLAEAEDITNRDGLRYGEIATDKLAYMANGLGKKASRTAQEETKLLACQLILSARTAEAQHIDN